MLKTESTRAEQIQRAFFRGSQLTLDNVVYLQEVRVLLEQLLSSDLGSSDLTTEALGGSEKKAQASIVAKGSGVAAGVTELCWLLSQKHIEVRPRTNDGGIIRRGDVLVEFAGHHRDLLACERAGLNLLQRMSGIATATHELQQRVQHVNSAAHLVATRKTPWGLLDKRAVHLGGGGTHRLGLWDAILIKNNHLAMLANREEEAAVLAIERAWRGRRDAAFIEVEVRSAESALAAARMFVRLQELDPDSVPCLLLLDNMPPAKISSVVELLQREHLGEYVLTEASGNISEQNIEQYATTGVDAISMGALTHSCKAFDLNQTLEVTGS